MFDSARKSARRFFARRVQFPNVPGSNLLWLARRPRLLAEWFRRWRAMPVISWIRAADYFIEGDFASSAQLYRQGLLQCPKHPAAACAQMDLSYCLYRDGAYEEAISELRSLLEKKPPLRDAYLLLARIYSFTGNPTAALETLEDALQHFPWDTHTLTTVLHSALWQNGATRSLAVVSKRLQELRSELLLDDSRRISIDTAIAHYQLSFGEEALGERLLVRALATGLAPFEAVVLRAERLLQQHRVYPAREQLGRAMRISPRNPHPVRLLAESYLLPGDFLEPQFAAQLATTACQLSKWQSRGAIEILARAQRSMGEVAIAELYEARAATLPKEAATAEFVAGEEKRDIRLRSLKVSHS